MQRYTFGHQQPANSVFCVCVCVLALFQDSVFCHKLGEAARLPGYRYSSLPACIHWVYSSNLSSTQLVHHDHTHNNGKLLHQLVNWKFTKNIGPLSRWTKVFVGPCHSFKWQLSVTWQHHISGVSQIWSLSMFPTCGLFITLWAVRSKQIIFSSSIFYFQNYLSTV